MFKFGGLPNHLVRYESGDRETNIINSYYVIDKYGIVNYISVEIK